MIHSHPQTVSLNANEENDVTLPIAMTESITVVSPLLLYTVARPRVHLG